MSRLCRWGFHNWSIWTEPIHVRWCYRCGRRDPEGPTAMEILLRQLAEEDR